MAALAAITVSAVAVGSTTAGAVRDGCTSAPSRAPWTAVGAPDAPDPEPFLSAHRGGTNLAPQQTPEAYKSALAFGATVIEVDLHVLADAGIAVFHNATGPNGEPIGQVTTAQFKSWNAATGSWAGTAFDPAHYVLFDDPTDIDALEIAKAAGAGLDIEFKDVPTENALGVPPYVEVATLVEQAGLMDTTIWQYNDLEQGLVAAVKSVDPAARFNYNIVDYESPEQLYLKASTQDFSFGSDLDKFKSERLAAIHDGCAIAVPHSYDKGADQEDDQIVLGRSLGIDGFQTNQVDVAADALDRPVPSEWRRSPIAPMIACLVNPANGFGLIGRSVERQNGTTAVTGPGGCVDAGRLRMRFAGDGAARPSEETKRAK